MRGGAPFTFLGFQEGGDAYGRNNVFHLVPNDFIWDAGGVYDVQS